MISSLRGSVLHVGAESVVVEVGGVGFAVAVPVPLARALHLGDEAFLHTNLVVRDDALSLYGFAERDELETFALLVSVSGVGPKSALGVLSALSVDQIAEAVAAEDDAPFRRVSGIGPKTAKLIVVQLAGKLHASPRAATGAGAPAATAVAAQVVAALVALGWSERVSTETVHEIVADASASDRAAVPALLKLALAQLGPSRTERTSV